MALSDYLTSEEWDACFYASLGQHATGNFGSSMHKTIDALLAVGHNFPGLDENGGKFCQVCNGVNAPKVCIFFGNPHKVDVLIILNNGREFLKSQLPSLVDETDAEWQKQMKETRERTKVESSAV